MDCAGRRPVKARRRTRRSGSPKMSTGSSALGPRAGGSDGAMKKRGEFPFEHARRVTAEEVAAARSAIASKLGKRRPRRGRPPKGADKYTPLSIRLHPKVIAWAKQQA